MNVPTLVIALVIAGLLVLAVRRLVRRGACSACEQHGACPAAGKGCSDPTQTRTGDTVLLGMPGGVPHTPTASTTPPADEDCCCHQDDAIRIQIRTTGRPRVGSAG